MIWEFYKHEKDHGKKTIAYDLVFNGQNRFFVFVNKPKAQRLANCQDCGTKIPREVPRIKFEASYYYGAGYYCLSCGLKLLHSKKYQLERANSLINKELKNLEELEEIAIRVMKDEWYPKKMALAKMLQVMESEEKEH